MAGTKINNYAEGNRNLTALMTSTDTQRRGYHGASLTAWAGTARPSISAGSCVEIGGALIEFKADETIAGASSDGTFYIEIDANNYTATFTASQPSWNDERQGFYNGNNRCLNYIVVRSGGSYYKYSTADASYAGFDYAGNLRGNNFVTSGGDISANNFSTSNGNISASNFSTSSGDISANSFSTSGGNVSCANITSSTGVITTCSTV